MANTRIQIKRSTNTQAPPTLFQGELCYTQNGSGAGGVTNSGLLFIGRPADNTAVPVGGVLTFGTLSPNQIISTNSTSYVDKLLTANLTAANAFLTTLYANGVLGNTGNVLSTNSTGGIYWGTVAAGGVTITMGNGLTSTQSPLTTSGTMSVNVGDASLKFATGALEVNLATTSGLSTTSGLTTVIANGMYLTAGGIGVNAAATSSLLANASGLWVLVGNGHTVNSTGYIAVNSSSSIAVNSTGTYVNLASSPGLITTSGLAVSPGSAIAVGATTQVNLATTSGLSTTSGLTAVVANGMSLTAAGLNVNAAATSGLVSNASGLWVQAANALTINATGFIGVNVATTSGLVSNASGLWTIGNNGISVTTGGVFANLAATPGLQFTSGGLAALTNTSQLVVAAGGITINATGVVTLQDLTCSGNLTVSGTLTALNTTTLQVKDNLIQLADGEATTTTFTDTVDTGLYVASGNTTVNVYSGIVRVAGSSTNTLPWFKIFATANTGTLTQGTTVTTTNTGFLQAYLAPYGSGGLFVVNGTNISISGNSSITMALAANTLSLTTALPATSGGTGTGVATTGDMLYASGTNAWGRIGIGVDGAVMQVSCTTIAWTNGLDGGTF